MPLPTELVNIKNWRPITLLNVDYKIFTHVIKNIILSSLPYIISNVQSGFQAGKSTSPLSILMKTLKRKVFFFKSTLKTLLTR